MTWAEKKARELVDAHSGYQALADAAIAAAIEEAAQRCDGMHDSFVQADIGRGINRGSAACAALIRSMLTEEVT